MDDILSYERTAFPWLSEQCHPSRLNRAKDIPRRRSHPARKVIAPLCSPPCSAPACRATGCPPESGHPVIDALGAAPGIMHRGTTGTHALRHWPFACGMTVGRSWALSHAVPQVPPARDIGTNGQQAYGMDFAPSWSCPAPTRGVGVRGMGPVAGMRLGTSVGREKECNIHRALSGELIDAARP
jgi:hypothetical protein